VSHGTDVHFLGVHVGRHSLRARLLAGDGTPVELREKRFDARLPLGEALQAIFHELSQHAAWPSLKGAAVGLDKGQRCSLEAHALQRQLPNQLPLLIIPAQLASLLGAVPHGPSMLISMGSELRLAALDSTHSYREFRLQEGGAHWWVQELHRLAEHSPKLRRALSEFKGQQKIMRALPRLLEGADFPAPDPVLKARLDGLCELIATNCLGLCSRLPGISAFSLCGFLHPSPMSARVRQAVGQALPQPPARFPAEVGAALLGLALHKENEERRHLGKPLEDGKAPAGQWTASPLLVRRLYRLRRPFERFNLVSVR
jgi:hypothetical protein